MGSIGNKFTWTNGRHGVAFTKERLDRAFCNATWTEAFPNTKVFTLPTLISDYCPLLITIEGSHTYRNRKEKPFRFEAKWVLREDYQKLVEEAWMSHKESDNKLNAISAGLNQCKQKLLQWSKQRWGNSNQQLSKNMTLLTELQKENKGQLNDQIKQVQRDTNKLLEEENLRWQQRAKQRWLREGDRNTKFFHQCASLRRKVNMIKKLVDDDGQEVHSNERISSLFQDYYKEFFSTSSPENISTCLESMEPRVTEDMNANLTRIYTQQEIEEALFQMEGLSSPGLDGFPAAFYQKQWPFIGKQVSEAILQVLNSNVAFEAMHTMKSKMTGKEGYMALKLDMSKAYDREINSVISSFWWGQQNHEHIIHWISWEKLGKAKSEGGMGFRDFEAFNKAMLAKQCWGLIQHLDSLAAQVIKAKYYPSSTFLEAKLGSKPSYVWRSFLAARPLIEAGSYWRIGNGNQVQIWKDRWTLHTNPSRAQSSVRVLENNATVSNLIDPVTKQWDRALVQHIFNAREADIILKTPISSLNSRDKLVWQGTREGVFSTMDCQLIQEFVVVAKKIWWRRNSFIFKGSFVHSNAIVKEARSLLEMLNEESSN
ncbi:uncharacterized protein LOC121238231 [Juglans microcarpa x Juglans regia]|uniref:uncharacterized protein LOC121238231 n=1 Tax=Juglans microcarpa x Juglans regia TaxID=2249226 RepID=UPI001B7E2146|nr:uncharacterized protein LOC121238231 [Juglans microcarpa x Juglans regia]